MLYAFDWLEFNGKDLRRRAHQVLALQSRPQDVIPSATMTDPMSRTDSL
jgi:hypothetical protein